MRDYGQNPISPCVLAKALNHTCFILAHITQHLFNVLSHHSLHTQTLQLQSHKYNVLMKKTFNYTKN